MSRKLWISLFGIWLLAACGTSQPTLTTAALPAGWLPIEQPGFSLALPTAWQLISSENADMNAAIETAANANPQMAALVAGAQAAFATGQLRLVAYDLEPAHLNDSFITNLTIGVVPTGGASLSDLRSANLVQLKQEAGFSALQEAEAQVAGLPAVQFRYGLKVNDAGGAPLSLQVEQYLFVHQQEQFVLTFTTTPQQAETFAPMFKQVLETVRVTGAT